MNQSKMLNYLLGTTSKVEILRVLFKSDDAMTGRRIASTAGISPRSCQLSLDSLVKNKALFRKAVGRAYSYTLNRDHKMVWDLLAPIFEDERGIHKKAGQLINKVSRPSSADIVSIFWNLTMTKKSESLKYVIVAKSKKSSVNKELVTKINEEVEKQFGYATKGEFVSAQEFSKKYFSSEAAKKRFDKEFDKLKGEAFADLVGLGKKGKK